MCENHEALKGGQAVQPKNGPNFDPKEVEKSDWIRSPWIVNPMSAKILVRKETNRLVTRLFSKTVRLDKKNKAEGIC